MKEREPKNKFLEAALFYAQRMGWPVFPLAPRTKVPLKGSKGCLDATTNEKQIRLWWEIEPAANVATPTGLSFWVLDNDPRNGGDQSLMQLVAKHGALADTLQQVTGGGGGQRFYRRPEGIKIGCHNGVWPGIDVKAEGGYVVAPPSIHPDTGEAYFWDTGKRTILEETINPAPKWLIDEILQSTHANGESGPVELPERLEKGARDQTIYRMACAFRRARGEYVDVLRHLTEYDQKHCVPPLGAKIIKAKVDSAWKKPAGAREDGPTGEPPADKTHYSAGINIDAVTPSLELLNACEVFGGRFRFIAVERRGPLIAARFAGIATEAVWPTMHELINFAKSQEILAEATQTLMQSPPRRAAKTLWEPAAQLILRLAGASDMTTADSLRDEFQHIILSTWKRAGCPHAREDEVFFEILEECLEHRRDPQAAQPPRCCVWHDDHCSFVHQPSLVEWLSTPAARNKHYDWSDVRQALSLLDFKREQIHLSQHKQTVNVRLWRGPLELLIDDES